MGKISSDKISTVLNLMFFVYKMNLLIFYVNLLSSDVFYLKEKKIYH